MREGFGGGGARVGRGSGGWEGGGGCGEEGARGWEGGGGEEGRGGVGGVVGGVLYWGCFEGGFGEILAWIEDCGEVGRGIGIGIRASRVIAQV